MLGVAAVALVLLTGQPAVRHLDAATLGVHAKVDYVSFQFAAKRKPRIRIWRNDQLVTRELIDAAPRQANSPEAVVPVGVTARDLDGDGEPEVLVELSSNAAYCCSWWRVYSFSGKRYVPQLHWWGDINAVPAIRDLDHDKQVELVSVDDRFAALAPHVAAAYPLQIWQYRHGDFRNVTRQYPDRIAAHAAGLWSRYQQGVGPARYVLAAWAADEYLLGRQAQADHSLDAALRKGDFVDRLQGPDDPAAFLRFLKAFLRRNSYA